MNLTHDHIHHPKLGDIPTNGNRFQAVLDAARELRDRQVREQFHRALLDALNARHALRPADDEPDDPPRHYPDDHPGVHRCR